MSRPRRLIRGVHVRKLKLAMKIGGEYSPSKIGRNSFARLATALRIDPTSLIDDVIELGMNLPAALASAASQPDIAALQSPTPSALTDAVAAWCRECVRRLQNEPNERNPLCRAVRTLVVVVLPGKLDRLSDDALLAALVLGDRDGAAVFVRRFQRKVYGLAWVITNDRSTAEDVAQMAFERAWRHGGNFDPRRASVTTWLLTITRNLAIDAVRVRRPDAVDPTDLLAMLPPVIGGDPEKAAVHANTMGRLRPALDALPIEQRRAVLLATMGGRTTTEISAIEGVPIPTAKTRLRTGLAKLTTAMMQQEADG